MSALAAAVLFTVLRSDVRIENQILWPADNAAEDWLGGGNSGNGVCADGDTFVVGAPWDDDGGDRSGAAWVFVRSAGSWVEQAKLVPGDVGPGDWAGTAVALSGDTALVGSDNDDDNGNNAGAAWVFVRSGSSWSEQAKLLASDGGDFDDFGHALALDGDTAVVGAFNHTSTFPGDGAVYVFVRSGTTWTEQAKLVAADPDADDEFGKAVAIDGDTLVVGARYDDDVGSQAGSAYVFVRSGTSWSQQAKLTVTDITPTTGFGFNVAVSGDTALIGALGDDSLIDDAGAAHVFTRSGSTWSREAKLIAPDWEGRDFFGFSVDLEGDRALIGAYQQDAAQQNPGKACLFERSGTQWTWRAELVASDGLAGADFGRAVSLASGQAIVTAPHANGAAADSGAVFSFDLDVAPVSVPLCFGDGDGAPCPCGNQAAEGSHAGCANTLDAGALLFTSGSASVGADDLVLHGRHLLPFRPALAFAGLNALGGGDGVPFGDGLRCAGGDVVRLGAETPDAIGATAHGPGLAARAGIAPGDVRLFQAWYRDPSGPCGAGSNLTNALEVAFVP